ncbi:signal peptidase II [Bacteriovorax stolpii]|uniref:Lipoprotein signal peptidase n=1 Tax=Bacteriovorax stolpii TaxID=960 RepID=A0A2K9NQ76_BACTC|nr:signal peptidase II [Bacteriovorax stolpii]AUN97686.1 signal peptidase II [Bacteriovorax stolpii]TDP51505.1 signal peptidase II [Bacteriovorax stolpii]
MKKIFLILICVSFFTILIDQFSKMYIADAFYFGESITIIPEFFNITHVRNPGAAFGIFADSHPVLRSILLLGTPPLAVLLICFFLFKNKKISTLEIYAYSLIVGGALGNFADRYRLGFVVDFLDFHINRRVTWPAFNFADSFITTGAFILIVLSFKKSEELIPEV